MTVGSGGIRARPVAANRVRGGSAWSENAVAVVLVPVGILMGALLAAAMLARLLALPFVALSIAARRRAE